MIKKFEIVSEKVKESVSSISDFIKVMSKESINQILGLFQLTGLNYRDPLQAVSIKDS